MEKYGALTGKPYFYGWGEPKYVLLMLVSVLLSYLFGLLIERFRTTPAAKAVCILSVAVSLSFLLYFKYTDFFIESFNAVTGQSIPLLKIALPIGISFYTFQIISYTIDVYRGVPAQKSYIRLAAYISMFPQLIAGPIVRYSDIAAQLEERSFSVSAAANGIRRFILGLSKKILLANQLGEFCAVFRASDEKSVLFYWLYAAAFALQIYFDFSGYSDMAIGLGKILGFDFLENFNYPYISASITEFWRRWHMSLGTWFRDYVYIPLGGNRKGPARQILNILIVWALTGFWHGAAWNFAVWGLLFAALLIAEKLWLLKPLKKCRLFSHIYVLFFVTISFVIFNAQDMAQAVSDIGGLFGAGALPLISGETLYYMRSFGIVLGAAAIGATPLIKSLALKASSCPKTARIVTIAEPVLLMALLLVMTGYLVDGSFNPFLYFRF
ncbi:MAG: MBOAT family O-acyltransferase [Eisenbergiella sp.]